MTSLPKRRLIEDLEHGFPTQPPGCHIAFDRVAGERVLASLKYIARQTWLRLARELQGYPAMKGPGNVSLANFLNDQALELSDIYRANAAGGWTALRRSAGLLPGDASDEEAYLGRRFADSLHSNDPLATDASGDGTHTPCMDRIYCIDTNADGTLMETIARLFKNGSSQAVRLPKECRFEGEEVVVKRFGDMVILVPTRHSYRGLMAQLKDMGPIRLGRRAQPRRRDKRDF